jgi:hypothetical protein
VLLLSTVYYNINKSIMRASMFWDFFTQIYRLPMMVFKRALSNPMGIFVYGILSKWYAMVMIATIIITFWVFKGLEKAGVIDAINLQLQTGFEEAKSVAQHCTPLIMNLNEMWSCVQNPPAYVPTIDDSALSSVIMQDAEDNVKAGANIGNRNQAPAARNPYDDEADAAQEAPAARDSSASEAESTVPTTPTVNRI